VWDESEYRKLAAYDDTSPGPLAVFRCHQQTATGRGTVCRGWLSVHGFESPAVRLAVATGQVEAGQVEAPVDVPLYGSGAEACAAGLAGVEDPDAQARAAIGKLIARGVGNDEADVGGGL
jgi:hypothetical protein